MRHARAQGLHHATRRLDRGRRAVIGASALRDVLGHAVRRIVPTRRDLPIETFALTRDNCGGLMWRGVQLAPLLKRFGSPLFVVDSRKLDENLAEFTRGVECAYSYKTNPVPSVLSRLHERGALAEVISEYELWLARRLGVPGDRIVSNGPGRSPESFRAAIEIGALVHLNHREEIALVAGIARDLRKRARVGMRVVTEAGWGGQFGEPIAGGHAMDAYREMVARPELAVVSVHTHLGTGIASVASAERLAHELFDFALGVRRELGVPIEILDFGGSLGSRTVMRYSSLALRLNRTFAADLPAPEPSHGVAIADYVATLVRVVEERSREEDIPRPRIFVEPGRALTSDTQLLLCRVTSLKASGARVPHAILDAGVNIAEAVRNEFHQIYVDGAPRGAARPYRLVGPICTPMDTLVWSARLPELAPGDVLAILDAGAYFVPFSTSFSFPQPAIVTIDDGAVRLSRRRETFDDLVRRDIATDPARDIREPARALL